MLVDLWVFGREWRQLNSMPTLDTAAASGFRSPRWSALESIAIPSLRAERFPWPVQWRSNGEEISWVLMDQQETLDAGERFRSLWRLQT
eukprot:SAG31_NODE_43822_length_265_cov_0.927711_1_plen_88_part_11